MFDSGQQHLLWSRRQLARPLQSKRRPSRMSHRSLLTVHTGEFNCRLDSMGGRSWALFNIGGIIGSRQADWLCGTDWLWCWPDTAAVRVIPASPNAADVYCRSLIAIQAGVSREDMAIVTGTRKYDTPSATPGLH